MLTRLEFGAGSGVRLRHYPYDVDGQERVAALADLPDVPAAADRVSAVDVPVI